MACKYVRREFRELADRDLEAYFDALSTIYHVATDEGVALYGDKYRGAGAYIDIVCLCLCVCVRV